MGSVVALKLQIKLSDDMECHMLILIQGLELNFDVGGQAWKLVFIVAKRYIIT